MDFLQMDLRPVRSVECPILGKIEIAFYKISDMRRCGGATHIPYLTFCPPTTPGPDYGGYTPYLQVY